MWLLQLILYVSSMKKYCDTSFNKIERGFFFYGLFLKKKYAKEVYLTMNSNG